MQFPNRTVLGFRGIIKAFPSRFSLFQSHRNFYQQNSFGGTGVPPVQAQAEAWTYRLTAFRRTSDMRLGIATGGTFTDFVFLGTGEGWVQKPFYYGPDLEGGFAFSGPARWLEDYSTLLVLPGFHGQVLPQGQLLL